MRASSVIKPEINEYESYIPPLNNLKNALTKLVDDITDISSKLKGIGEGIGASGSIYGVPFDKGKIKDKAQEYTNGLTGVSSVISEIDSALNEISNKLEALWDEYARALEYEEEQRRKREREQQEWYARNRKAV